MFLIFTFIPFFPPVFPFFFALKNARASVIGIIAKVLVNLTVTALSRVAEPKLYMLSHVAAAAVTDDVSLIAVPAKTPKASPDMLEKPSHTPRLGNIIAASTVNYPFLTEGASCFTVALTDQLHRRNFPWSPR